MIFLIIASCGVGTAMIVFLLFAYFRADLLPNFLRFPLQIRHDYKEIEHESRNGYVGILMTVNSGTRISPRSQNLLNDDEILDNLINECDLEAERYAEEIDIIGQQLNKFNCEQRDHNKQVLIKLGINASFIAGRTASSQEEKKSPVIYEDTNIARCDEMVSYLIELLRTSPEYPDDVTLETVQAYKEAAEAHHDKLLYLANTLFPELQSLLNEQKQEQIDEEKTEDLASNHQNTDENKARNYRR